MGTGSLILYAVGLFILTIVQIYTWIRLKRLRSVIDLRGIEDSQDSLSKLLSDRNQKDDVIKKDIATKASAAELTSLEKKFNSFQNKYKENQKAHDQALKGLTKKLNTKASTSALDELRTDFDNYKKSLEEEGKKKAARLARQLESKATKDELNTQHEETQNRINNLQIDVNDLRSRLEQAARAISHLGLGR